MTKSNDIDFYENIWLMLWFLPCMKYIVGEQNIYLNDSLASTVFENHSAQCANSNPIFASNCLKGPSSDRTKIDIWCILAHWLWISTLKIHFQPLSPSK